jgi:hypothetical protein
MTLLALPEGPVRLGPGATLDRSVPAWRTMPVVCAALSEHVPCEAFSSSSWRNRRISDTSKPPVSSAAIVPRGSRPRPRPGLGGG